MADDPFTTTTFVFQVWHTPARRWCDKWSRNSKRRLQDEIKKLLDEGKLRVRWRIIKRQVREMLVLQSN